MPSNKSTPPAPQECRPQNISKIKGQWGGPRANSGGSRPGSGRPQRKPTPWPENTDLRSAKGLDKFLCRLIEETWRGNVLDPRTVGTLNNSLRLLLDLRGWTELDDELDILPAKDPVDYDHGKYRDSLWKEDPEEESSVENVDTPKDKISQGLQTFAAGAQAILDDPTTTPELKEKARQFLDTIKMRQDQPGQSA